MQRKVIKNCLQFVNKNLMAFKVIFTFFAPKPKKIKSITYEIKKDGNFTIYNTRIGGPFTLTVEYVGYAPQTINDITLNLGEPFVADVVLSQKAQTLNEVTITL